jgi:UDP-galactopyranose mutase
LQSFTLTSNNASLLKAVGESTSIQDLNISIQNHNHLLHLNLPIVLKRLCLSFGVSVSPTAVESFFKRIKSAIDTIVLQPLRALEMSEVRAISSFLAFSTQKIYRSLTMTKWMSHNTTSGTVSLDGLDLLAPFLTRMNLCFG